MRSILIWPTKLQNICIAANAKEATEKFWQSPLSPVLSWLVQHIVPHLGTGRQAASVDSSAARLHIPISLALYMRSGLIWPTRLVMALSVAADCAEASEKFWQQSSMAWAAPSSSSA